MPLAFPSHQGLILPLWYRYPRHFDGLALCIGSAMPDLVDGAAWIFRGELGQWLGHSLVGLGVCVPAGLLFTVGQRRLWPKSLELFAPPRTSSHFFWLSLSLGVGALSHIFFDLICHGNFLLLFPWYSNDRWFPSWWYQEWGRIPLGVYKDPYPLATHTLIWCVLSILGAFLFFRILKKVP